MTDWKNKLAAYLHDPPSKCLDIASHGQRSAAAFNRAGIFDETEVNRYLQAADHTAAAADRIPFPNSSKSGIRCRFDGVENRFRHPLGGEQQLRFQKALALADAEETEGKLQPVPLRPEGWSDDQYASSLFFAHWRRWKESCAEKDPRLAFLPADTRIPDHSIWTHMAIVSAFAGCADPTDGRRVSASLLRLQIGPVQDFIAAARNTRDLWSASYLLSWLMAAGLKFLALKIGPDAVIFPNLQAQPIFDLHLRDNLWSQLREADGAETYWDGFAYEPHTLLTPNLPNIFLALVPTHHAEKLAEGCVQAIRDEWRRIANDVAEFVDEKILPKEMRERYDRQVCQFLQIAWQTSPLSEEPAANLGATGPDPHEEERKRVRAVIAAFEEAIPEKDRDGRFYEQGRLRNPGIVWSLDVLENAWLLDGVKQARCFDAWSAGGWSNHGGNGDGWLRSSQKNAKDVLNGREEMLAGGSGFTASLEAEPWKSLFKHDDEFGASTLIKRTWHLAYLCKSSEQGGWGFQSKHFRMPDTLSVAQGKPTDDTVDTRRQRLEEVEEVKGGRYFAVLAFDGDSIGEWVSGARTPHFGAQLADYQSEGERRGTVEYFETHARDFLCCRRPLSPSYHLQFSEALSNFANHCAARVVEAHQGRLIYAGGDDVVAMLPADQALSCADTLQRLFRGQAPEKRVGVVPFEGQEGFLVIDEPKNARETPPFLVPGPRATASVGIAIAHFKSPLQDVVREAQAAEKRAKREMPGKHAISLSIFKRSGEISHWTARFGDPDEGEPEHAAHRGGVRAIGLLKRCLDEGFLTARFPYQLIELLQPYVPTGGQTSDPEFDAASVIEQDLARALRRQEGPNAIGNPEARVDLDRLREAIMDYVRHIPATGNDEERPGSDCAQVRSMINLCTVSAFLVRQDQDGLQ